MKRHKSILFLTILLIFLSIKSVVAENDFTEPDFFTNEDDEVLFQEIPSVYSASKYEQKVSKAPASISIVTAEEIEKYGYRTFAEILSSLKGIYNTNDRTYGYAGVRGFGLPSDFNARLLLLIDGHRYNDNIYQAFDTSGSFPVDIDNIERLEVVRGPSSSLYGTSAFFGVINIITKRGRDIEGTNITGSYGSNGTYKTRLSYGNRLENGLEVFLSGSFYDSQGDDRFYSKERDEPEFNNGIYENNDEEQTKNLLANLSFGDFTLQGAYVYIDKDVPTASFETLFNHSVTSINERSAYLDLKYDHTFENQLNIISRLSYDYYRYSGKYPYDYPPVTINKDLTKGQSWRVDIELTKTLWSDHRVTLGAEFQDNFEQFQTNYDEEVYIDSDETSYEWGVFLQDEYSITDTLTLNAGLRFDHFSTFGDTINPRAALIYKPFEKTALKFLYGNAFRAPNAFELNYGDINYAPSNNLEPEELETLEFIFEQYLNNEIRTEINFFYTRIDGIISLVRRADELLQNQNTGKVDSYGTEVQLEGKWENGYQGRISYSWQETKSQTTHKRLNNSPEHMVKVNLIAPVWENKVFLGLENQYMSGRKTASGGNVGDFVITNLTLFSKDTLLKGLDLSASVYNVFDEKYFDPGSAEHIQNGIEQEGLTFRIKFSLSL
ncbi:MAG: TonB-dependent receptor [Gammaproteobacteria bacterium]